MNKLYYSSYSYLGDDLKLDLTIPFIKEIDFKNKIAEISSISLEKDISINDNDLLGDFIISGEYKNLDINIDTIPFRHVIPFSTSLNSDIDINSLSYDVIDFNYEIVDEEILKVEIKLHIFAQKKLEEIKSDIFEKVEYDDRNNIVENIVNNGDNNEIKETVDNQTLKQYDFEEDYIKYHIHYVKLNETIESISKEYNISYEELVNLNQVESVSVGDKLIIPEINE